MLGLTMAKWTLLKFSHLLLLWDEQKGLFESQHEQSWEVVSDITTWKLAFFGGKRKWSI